MRKARVRSPQYSRFLTSPLPSAMKFAKVSVRASTCDAEISWRAMKTVSYNAMPCDPLWIFATRRWSTFDGSRSSLAELRSARSEGAHYTQSDLRRKRATDSDNKARRRAGIGVTQSRLINLRLH